MADIIGRQISYGLGKETVRGTAVSAGHWIRHLSADFWTQSDKVMNESANGNVAKYNDSDIARIWSEGSIEAKIQDESFGLVLLGALGEVSTSANVDASGIVYDHTFSISNSAIPQSLTVVQKSTNDDRAYALAVVDSFEIASQAGDYAKFTLGLVAKKHASASSTVAYADENEFTSKHISVKMATDVAGLSGASAIAVEEVNLSLNRNVEPYYAHGDVEPTEINGNEVEVTGTMTLRWSDTTYEDLSYDDTKQAVEIEMINSDVTIGTAENPTITMVMPKVSLETVDVTKSLAGIVKQTVNFTAMFDSTESKLIDIVLTNLEASY